MADDTAAVRVADMRTDYQMSRTRRSDFTGIAHLRRMLDRRVVPVAQAEYTKPYSSTNIARLL